MRLLEALTKILRTLALCMTLGFVLAASFFASTKIDVVIGFVFRPVTRLLLWITGWSKSALALHLIAFSLIWDLRAFTTPAWLVAGALFNYWFYTVWRRFIRSIEPMLDGDWQPSSAIDLSMVMASSVVIVTRCVFVIFFFLAGGLLGTDGDSLLLALGLYCLSGRYPGKTAREQVRDFREAHKFTPSYGEV
jgi:hypothetical protein